MLKGLQNIFKIPDLKKRILFTLGLIVVYRAGVHIPTPGVDSKALSAFFEQSRGTLLGLLDMFTGGALKTFSIFALGIMPYISASIILQLLTVVIPYLERLAKEGEIGRRKINQYTRYGTILLSAIQAWGMSIWMQGMKAPGGASIVVNPGLGFQLMAVITLTSGTAFIMWLGEQITERGIGNGISLIITVGIIAHVPSAIVATSKHLFVLQDLSAFSFIALLAIMAAVVAGVILILQGQRKFPIQSAQRIVGRRIYGGQSTYIPLRVNQAGVIPVIFASSIIMFPATIARFIPSEFMQEIANLLEPGALWYIILDIILIIFFTYFYTAITLNPADVAENLQKFGSFIPGIRPGRPTAEYIERSLTRLTLAGGIFLAAIDVLPTILVGTLNTPFYFGGTGLLIVVGVMLDTMKQIESHLLMRHYEGFMKKIKIKGRTGY